MEKYFKYPLCLMQYVASDDDKEGILSIISFGVMSFAGKINCQQATVAKQILYLYYRNTTALPDDLVAYIDEMIDGGRMVEDEDYNGFNGGTFKPEQENEGMMAEFAANPDFYGQCVNLYQQQQALSLLSVNPAFKPDMEGKFRDATEFIREFEARNGSDAWTAAPINLIFDVYNGVVPMDYLRLVAAAGSVLSKKNFNLTYKSVLLCRMFGAKKASILQELFNRYPQLKAKHDKLSHRRRWEKLINTAEEQGYFNYYSTGRQFFVSIVMTKEEMKRVIERRKTLKIAV